MYLYGEYLSDRTEMFQGACVRLMSATGVCSSQCRVRAPPPGPGYPPLETNRGKHLPFYKYFSY